MVEYVDYGNKEEVEVVKLRKPLTHNLFNLPPQVGKRQFTDVGLDLATWDMDNALVHTLHTSLAQQHQRNVIFVLKAKHIVAHNCLVCCYIRQRNQPRDHIVQTPEHASLTSAWRSEEYIWAFQFTLPDVLVCMAVQVYEPTLLWHYKLLP